MSELVIFKVRYLDRDTNNEFLVHAKSVEHAAELAVAGRSGKWKAADKIPLGQGPCKAHRVVGHWMSDPTTLTAPVSVAPVCGGAATPPPPPLDVDGLTAHPYEHEPLEQIMLSAR